MDQQSAIIRVTGHVQGVGFRYMTKQLAYRFDVSGTVKNLEDGSVEIRALAQENQLNQFIEAVKKGASPSARVDQAYVYMGAPVSFRSTFDIIY